MGPSRLAAGDFGFSDPFDSPISGPKGVKITTLPAAGTLKYGGQDVTAGQTVAFSGGSLVYTPAATDFTTQTPYSSFTFQVQDNGGTANGGVDLDPTPTRSRST